MIIDSAEIEGAVDIADAIQELTLADVMESIRDEMGMSKVEMAKKLGISKSHYGNFVSGLESVSIKRAGEWAKILGHPEKVFIRYAIQDQLSKLDYPFRVTLSL